jgi:DNA replication protein DnaC
MSIASYLAMRRKMMKNEQKIQDETLEQIRKYLTILKLHRMNKALDEQLAYAARQNWGISKVIERLLAIEANSVIERRIERRIKQSKLPERKLLTDFDFKFQKGIDKSQIMELATLSFVERKQGLILAGSSGTGKSHIAKALFLIGCQKLYRCRYTTAAFMLADLMASLADGTLEHKLKAYTRPQILLIDEVGFDRLEQESARNASLFFKVIDARYCKNSTLLTTNIDFKALGDYLGDPVITTAIVDRMVHHSIIINIQGPSWRMKESK